MLRTPIIASSQATISGVASPEIPSALPYTCCDSKPFMQAFEIEAITAALRLTPSGMDCLEWGSGNSTLYFSSLLGPERSWVSIEHDHRWAAEVEKQIRDSGRSNVALHHIKNNLRFQDGVDDGTFEAFFDYVMAPGRMMRNFGFILVDGRARTACMAEGWRLLNAAGIMALHDAQRPEYAEGIPKDSFLLRVRHEALVDHENGNNVATLFMARSAEMALKLREALSPLSFVKLEMAHPQENHSAVTTSPHRFQLLLERKAARLDMVASRAPSAAAACGDGGGAGVPVDTIAGRTGCLFLNTYYPAFLESQYIRYPELAGKPYLLQLQDLQYQCFGDSDYYSKGLIEAGLPAAELVINCPPLQQAWAREHGSSAGGMALVVEQVRRISPDVLYVQDLNNTSAKFLEAVRPYVRLVAGQVATPVSQQVPFGKYDILFSSFPHYVAKFRSMGLTSYYQALAFDPRVLQRIQVTRYGDRPIGCSFIGGISQLHIGSYQLLELLAEKTPIEFWGYGAETLTEGSKVRQRHHGEAWGKEMFEIIGNSRLTINRHGEVAGNYANNMRLFEATGCGALLVTDYKENLDQLFEIGREVVAYRSPEECAALVNYYLAHPQEAERIARAGQLRTLRDHTYGKRMEYTAEILSRHLRYRVIKDNLPKLDPERINYGHTSISAAEITSEMTTAWQDPSIPGRQRALVQHELEMMYRGAPPLTFRVLAHILKPLLHRGSKLLEIGCASGYYYEVLEYLLNRRLQYTGVDYSQPMIDMAREQYPTASFFVADGASLFFADRSFHTVISSCVLLHVPNYRKHIAESARVAESFILASRTPVCRTRPTQYLKKFAYGVQTVELLFNEAELLREFALNGFEHTRTTEYYSNPGSDRYEVTYLFKRQG